MKINSNQYNYNKIVFAWSMWYALLFTLCALSTTTVFAQDGVGVRVQPSTMDERTDPGGRIDGVLTVTNQDGGRQKYFLGTRNIEGMDDSGRPVFSDVSSVDPMQAAAWITLDVASIDIDQGQTAEIPYHIIVPAEASPGSYFAAIFVTREAENPTETGAGVGFQVASLLSLRVNGYALEAISFREFFTDRALYGKANVHFTTRLENSGTVHERPRGIITISNLFGKKVAQIDINENGGGIMPRTDRVFESTWSTSAFTLGRYHALASVVYGDTEKQTITREHTFWLIPVKEVGVVIGGLALFSLLFTLGMRRYVRNALKRAGYTATAAQTTADQVSFGRRLFRTFVWLVGLLALLFIATLVFFA